MNVINENNESLKNDIEVFKHRLEIQHLDQPSRFDATLFNSITKLSNDILNFNDIKKYISLIDQLEKTSKSQKININLKRIESDEVIVLTNNLLLNLTKFTKAFIVKYDSDLSSTHCFFGNLIKYENTTIADSVIVDFKTNNPFSIVIDSIVENKKAIKYNNTKKFLIGQLKYKKTNNNSQIFGKIFYTNENGESILVQKINK